MKKSIAFSAALGAAILQSSPTFPASGVQSNGGGEIGTQHINFAAPFGDTVSYIILGDEEATATGTFVPSTVPGQLKFLTAAHNVDDNNDGVPDFDTVTLFFGAAPGEDGSAASFGIEISADQIAINPNWNTPGSEGMATNDLSVLTFSVGEIVSISGGNLPQVSPISTDNPLGQQAIVIGHGLHGDGTIPLDDAVGPSNEVDGVLKGGSNVIDFVGTPGNLAPPTISPDSGVVVLTDFDGPDPAVSTLPGANSTPGLEAGTASGDSGSPLLADTNNDGIFEVAGVLNGGDNPFAGPSEFGDISQYAPVFTNSAQTFLRNQGVFLGTDANGTVIGGMFAIIDTASIVQNQLLLNEATSLVSGQIGALQRNAGSHLNIVSNRRFRASSGFSLLNEPAQSSDVGTFSFVATEPDLSQSNPSSFEVFASGGLISSNSDNSSDYRQYNGQVGFETRLGNNTLGGFAFGYSDSHGEFEAEGVNLSAYSITEFEQFFVSGAFGWSQSDIDSRMGTTRFQSDADLFSVELAVSTNRQMGEFILTPHGNIRYTFGEMENIRATSGGNTATVPDQEIDQWRGEVGFRANVVNVTSNGTIIPFVGGAVGYRNNSSGGAVSANSAINPFFGLQSNGGAVNLTNLAAAVNSEFHFKR